MGASTLTNSRAAGESVGFVAGACAAMAGATRRSVAVANRIESIGTSTWRDEQRIKITDGWSALINFKYHMHPGFQMLRDVAVHHPTARIRHLDEQIHRTTSGNEDSVFP